MHIVKFASCDYICRYFNKVIQKIQNLQINVIVKEHSGTVKKLQIKFVIKKF